MNKQERRRILNSIEAALKQSRMLDKYVRNNDHSDDDCIDKLMNELKVDKVKATRIVFGLRGKELPIEPSLEEKPKDNTEI